MIIKLDKTGTVSGLNNLIDEILINEDVKGLLVLACDENNFTPNNLDKKLQEIPLPLFGGTFPGILYKKEKLKKGTIVAGLSQKPNIQIIHNLSDMAVEYDDIIDERFPEIGNTKTMFVFFDGFSKRISALVDSLFNVFGLEFNYIGGGGGSMSMKQKPCLLTNEGLIQDSAVLAMLDMESGVGVRHGWDKISGPYKVTESDRNIIQSLDWKPAFEVYREIVEKHSGKVFTDHSFFNISKCYPFGISKLGAEVVVRDPFLLGENGSLICVGEVPQDSFVNILTGDVSSLVDAARKALALAQEVLTEKGTNKITFFMDCISRVLFLGDKFNMELNAVSDENIPLIGALTIGEIANSRKDYLEFYNKTAVVAVLEG